jgi:TrmH family RNA methyltransferase
VTVLRSRDNVRVKRWRKLATEPRLRREERCTVIEGAHLLAEYLDRVGPPLAILVAERTIERPEVARLVRRSGLRATVLADNVFGAITESQSPTGVAAEIRIPSICVDLATSSLCIMLEGVQDAGNVGAILRSAAAFGATHAVLSKGCADAWSPKVLRAAMGGHFRLRISQDADLPSALEAFAGKTVCTVPRGGTPLHRADLSGRVAWVFGGEGSGVSEALRSGTSSQVSIPMPGGAESLNVGAAAAICLYETFRRQALA